jgi:hypothetical protein
VFFKGRLVNLLIAVCLIFPIYETVQILLFNLTNIPETVTAVKFMKDTLFFGGFAAFFLYQRDLYRRSWRILPLDVLFGLLMLLIVSYAILPIGSASALSKLVYFKNISLIWIMYFLGRNVMLPPGFINRVFKLLLVVTCLVFCFNLVEVALNTHFQTIIGFPYFNSVINESDPAGNYGLTWTFEAGDGAKRFAGFMANPLQLAIFAVFVFCFVFFYWNHSFYGTNKTIYFLGCALALLVLIMTHSRASFIAFFLFVGLTAVLFGYFKLIFSGLAMAGLFCIYVFYFAEDDLRYFVIDTVSLADSSSLGHVLEWVEAWSSMLVNPWGLGLATSGNMGGVDEALKVGGENQYLIMGVQLGWLGFVLYLLVVLGSIISPIRRYYQASTADEKMLPFVAAGMKVALLVPLFTANAETYSLTAYLSWWLVGASLVSTDQA